MHMYAMLVAALETRYAHVRHACHCTTKGDAAFVTALDARFVCVFAKSFWLHGEDSPITQVHAQGGLFTWTLVS